MNYRDNFDEFGNLREDHSPWRISDVLICAMAFGFIAALVAGVV
jgi:hypothetical protein